MQLNDYIMYKPLYLWFAGMHPASHLRRHHSQVKAETIPHMKKSPCYNSVRGGNVLLNDLERNNLLFILVLKNQ